MRKLLFYAFWILITLALPYSIKAQSAPEPAAPSHPTHARTDEAVPVAR